MALSLDLRRRIVSAYLRGDGTYAELAARFEVGEATISRLLRRHRERGNVERDPRGGGVPQKIPPQLYPQLRKLVAQQPDRTVEQLCHAWRAFGGERLSRSAMMRTLRKAGLTWKKNAFVLRSRTDPKLRLGVKRSRSR